jgi:hypothetical protein
MDIYKEVDRHRMRNLPQQTLRNAHRLSKMRMPFTAQVLKRRRSHNSFRLGAHHTMEKDARAYV